MSDERREHIGLAQTIAQCIDEDRTIAATGTGATAAIPLVKNVDAAAVPEEIAAPAPRVADRYARMGVLGQGGMGRVIEARDGQFGRTVALKEMTAGQHNPEFIRRFLLESIVTANLEHPGVVAVYERGVSDGAPYYVMRKVVGQPLSKAITTATTLEARLALVSPLIRVAHALGFAHQRGVVHRDIKPDNIVLGEHGESVILDWGIAKVRGLEEKHDADSPLANVVRAGDGTVAGALLGTPSYMSPEQAHGHVDAIDARTDVFALGAVLYEALSGRPLYREESLALTLSAAGMRRFEPLDRVAPEVPAALRAIVTRALAERPADRFEDGSALARALEQVQSRAWLGEESVAARWFARAIALVGLVVTVLAAVAVWVTLPSLRRLGVGAYFFVLAAVGALSLAAFEWRTRGRYQTHGVALALVAACVLGGFANAMAGVVLTFGAASRAAVLRDEQRWRGLVSAGVHEAVGNIAGACALAAFATVVLAIVHRRNALLLSSSPHP